jgi:hypothetical protein
MITPVTLIKSCRRRRELLRRRRWTRARGQPADDGQEAIAGGLERWGRERQRQPVLAPAATPRGRLSPMRLTISPFASSRQSAL